jgi:hypothetical protein
MRKTTSLNSPPKRHFWDINAVLMLRKKKETNPIKAHAPTLKIFGSNELPYNWLKIFRGSLAVYPRALHATPQPACRFESNGPLSFLP